MSDKQTDAPQKQVHWANDYGSYSKSWHKSRNHADEAAIGPPIEIGPRIAVIRREQTGDKIEYYKEDV